MARTDSPKDDSSSDSSKKVAKAARAGQTASSSGQDQRDLGFPLALAAVIVVGIALVVFARQNRDTTALTPTFGDHWHVAYGIYDCQTDSFLPNLQDPQTPNPGIHTHGDGVVHVHPTGSNATGNNAQVKVFLEAARAEINDDSELTFPDRDALTEEGTTCDGEPAILQIARFAPFTQELVEVTTVDIEDYRFLEDQESITIALAPLGADIPPPPQANLDAASAASPFVLGTDGVGDIGNLDAGTDTSNVGFDDDGNLVDGEGNILIPADDLVIEGDETNEG